ncbi:MAG: hypothetical protein RL240_325 [Planctomycetota bacterium]|jgi:hypothetical protein
MKYRPNEVNAVRIVLSCVLQTPDGSRHSAFKLSGAAQAAR